MSDFTIKILIEAAVAASFAKFLKSPIDINEAIEIGRLAVLYKQDTARIVRLRHERRNRRRPIQGATTLSEDAQLLGVRLLGKSGLSLKARQF